ncbi:unnamed protein product [Prorocentrum cordatum]|uniref:Uncharacterized protein n=1 Tax=Prorocentrum cordatum TaxID=2364126 RepID=A0ABN9W6P2_9DINO|nr:unnamed protein product [Polarella glacialis]
MPPKKSGAAKKGKSSKGSSDADRNPLLDFDNRFCEDCGQWTHSEDRDGPKGQVTWLKWHKRNHTSKGEVLTGDQCYGCYGAQRKILGTRVTLADARATRKNDPAIDEKIVNCRKGLVDGTGKHARTDGLTINTQKSDMKFNQDFDSGIFQPIQYVGRTRSPYQMIWNLKWESQENLIQQIEARGTEVVEDDCGVLGIEVSDVSGVEFGACRFKRGRERASTKVKTEGASLVDPGREADETLADDKSVRSQATSARSAVTSVPPATPAPSLKKKATLEDAEKKYHWGGHWGLRNREKEFQAFIARLQRAGKATGGMAGSQAALDISARIFAMADALEARQGLLDKIGGKPREFYAFASAPLSQEHSEMIKGAPMELVSTILALNLNALIDKVPTNPEYVGALLSALTVESSNTLSLSTLLECGDADRAKAQAAKLQTSLVLALGNVVFKITDESAIGLISQKIVTVFPKLADSIFGMDMGSADFVNGLAPQAAMDLGAMSIVAQVLDHMRAAGAHGPVFPAQLRHSIVKLVSSVAKVSARMKVNFKSRAGSHATHGKKAWEEMCRMTDAAAKHQEDTSQNEFVKRARELAHQVRVGGPEKAYEALIAVCELPSEACNFGDFFSQRGVAEDSDSPAKGDILEVCNTFCDGTLQLFNVAVDLTMSFNDLFTGIYEGSGYTPPLTDRQVNPDEEEPDQYEMLRVFHTAFKTMQHFDLNEGDANVVYHLMHRFEVAAKLYDARESEGKTDCKEVVEVWTMALQAEHKMKLALRSRPLPTTCPTAPSALLILRNIGFLYMDDRFRSVLLHRVLALPPDEQKTLIGILDTKTNVLPKSSLEALTFAKTLVRVADADERQRAGRSSGLVGLNSLLSDIATAKADFKEACDDSALVERVLKHAEAEWDTLFKQTKAAMDFISSLKLDFVEKYGALYDAIDKWDFQEVGWLTKPSGTKDRNTGSQIATAVAQFPTTSKVVENVCGNIKWQESAKSQAMIQLQAALPTAKETLGQAAKLAACIALAHLLVVGGSKAAVSDYDQTVKWTQSCLGVSHGELPSKLREKLEELKRSLLGDPINKATESKFKDCDAISVATSSAATAATSRQNRKRRAKTAFNQAVVAD